MNSDIKSENQTSAFYGAMTEIGRAIERLDLADKAWDAAVASIAERRTASYARRFLDGKYGLALALLAFENFPKGASPNLITDERLKKCVVSAIESWKHWPRMK